MLPLDEGFIPVLPGPGAAAQPGYPRVPLVGGDSPWQCHCHPAEPAGSVSCSARKGEKRQGWKGGRKVGNKGAAGHWAGTEL